MEHQKPPKTRPESFPNKKDADELTAEVELDAISNRGVYTSRLPETQPLYQIYMLQEQEKMLEESAIPALASLRIGPSSSSSDSGNGRDTEADSVCDPNEHDELVGALVGVAIRANHKSRSAGNPHRFPPTADEVGTLLRESPPTRLCGGNG